MSNLGNRTDIIASQCKEINKDIILGPKVKYKVPILKPSDMEYKYFLELSDIINASPYNSKKEAVEFPPGHYKVQSICTFSNSPIISSNCHTSRTEKG
jgi:hypothetical protein